MAVYGRQRTRNTREPTVDAPIEPEEPEEDWPSSERPFICGLLKVRNEVVRESNIRRCLANMQEFCDTIVACDDASTDGTELILLDHFDKHGIPRDQILCVPPEEQSFRQELRVKARMLHKIHKLKPMWIWWQDADEVLPDPSRLVRFLIEQALPPDDPEKAPKRFGAYRFPYVQLWRSGSFARIDDGFADGSFVKLWRWHVGLEFDIVDRTHHMQFPHNVGEIGEAPAGMHVIHFGNYGKNLQWKAIQYHGGLGGVDRHLEFDHAQYQRLDVDYTDYPKTSPVSAASPFAEQPPKPFTDKEKTLIRSMEGLRGLKGWFTVVIPTYNRATFLVPTLSSLLAQTYQKWIALVLDDGSTDDTEAIMHRLALHDPRIFYARHDKRGAVAMNEIGMRFACDATEWWTRLGSDDVFSYDKLLNDAIALQHGSWCYGPYRVMRQNVDRTGEGESGWLLAELCNGPADGDQIVKDLLAGKFRVSWANIAARTSLLRRVHELFGSFCDPRLRNMEDFLVNTRLARFAEPVFRARTESDPARLHLGFDENSHRKMLAMHHLFRHDAVWRVNPVGASADTTTTGDDDALTHRLIQEDSSWAKRMAP